MCVCTRFVCAYNLKHQTKNCSYGVEKPLNKHFQKEYLDAHALKHSAEKTHHCLVCNESFSAKRYLKKHVCTRRIFIYFRLKYKPPSLRKGLITGTTVEETAYTRKKRLLDVVFQTKSFKITSWLLSWPAIIKALVRIGNSWKNVDLSM